MYCEEYLPHPVLRPYIRCYFYISVASTRFRFPADGCPGFIVNLGDPFLLGFGDGRFEPLSGVRVFGASTRHLVTQHLIGQTKLLAVKFHPGQLPRFFGFPAVELTDTSTSLDTICGKLAGQMESRLDGTNDLPYLIEQFDQALLACLSHQHAYDERISAALTTISRLRGQIRVDALAKSIRLSRRQFERRFLEVVGLTPKRMCRIARFLGVFAALPSAASHDLDWADLAFVSGYSDQAHLVRECRFFTGHSPLAYLKDRTAIEHTIMSTSPPASR